MNNQEILDNAPDGANEIDDTGRYWIYKGDGDYLLWDGKEWIENWSPLHTRSLADIREMIQDKERIAELEQKLKPSLYWDASNTEISHDSIEELMHCKFEDGAEVGDEVEIQRAALLPNETYIFTTINDEDYSCEYELKEHKGDE